MILRLKDRDRAKLTAIWDDAISRIHRLVKSKDDDLALRGMAQFFRLITAGDPPLHRVSDIGSADGDFTLEELLATLHRSQRERDALRAS